MGNASVGEMRRNSYDRQRSHGEQRGRMRRPTSGHVVSREEQSKATDEERSEATPAQTDHATTRPDVPRRNLEGEAGRLNTPAELASRQSIGQRPVSSRVDAVGDNVMRATLNCTHDDAVREPDVQHGACGRRMQMGDSTETKLQRSVIPDAMSSGWWAAKHTAQPGIYITEKAARSYD